MQVTSLLKKFFKSTFMIDCMHLTDKTGKNMFSIASERLLKSKVGTESAINKKHPISSSNCF